MYAIWWVSVFWLILAFALIIFFLLQWFIMKDNPLRHETVLVSYTFFLFSLPACLGVLVAAVVPKTGLSIYKRLGGVAILLLCVGVLVLHDYLQAKYR